MLLCEDRVVEFELGVGAFAPVGLCRERSIVRGAEDGALELGGDLGEG
jgi:hypothetical protein